jgi:hypothetical protein
MMKNKKSEIKNRWSAKIMFRSKKKTKKELLEFQVKRGANLGDAYLRGANLEGANLEGANLRGANLEDAYLEDAYLRGANLGGAYLGGAYLRGANLEGAYLRGANLRGAYLGGANLGGANLGGANLRGAYLRGANLRGAKEYSELHEFFYEVIRREKIETFTEKEWSFVGKISIHRLCWTQIKKRFGKEMLRVFEVIKERGYGEYYERYKTILEND